MIRREISWPGSSEYWALISQVEHARLSAELASHWNEPLVALPNGGARNALASIEAELLQAIEHHDDGWAEWEEAPEIDPEHGRPRSFTEMPQTDSLAIWSKSIAVAEQIGPLAAWVVAGHFLALSGSSGGERSAGQAIRAADEWRKVMQDRRTEWLQKFLRPAADRTPAMAEAALKVLQFFDAASLWFCCACPAEDHPPDSAESTLMFADGTPIRFHATAPAGAAAGHGGGSDLQCVVSVAPWPLATDALRLSVEAAVAPIQRYETTAELIQSTRRCVLSWRLEATQNSSVSASLDL